MHKVVPRRLLLALFAAALALTVTFTVRASKEPAAGAAPSAAAAAPAPDQPPLADYATHVPLTGTDHAISRFGCCALQLRLR